MGVLPDMWVTVDTSMLRFPIAEVGWSHGTESGHVKGYMRKRLILLIETPRHSSDVPWHQLGWCLVANDLS